MAVKNPRIYVTLNEYEINFIKKMCKKRNISMSACIRKMVEYWVEDYIRDHKLAIESEKQWEESGRKTISAQELWERLDVVPD